MFYSVNLIATEIQTCDIWQQNLSRNRRIENNHWMIRVSVPIATFLKLNELWPMVGGVPADLASPLPEPLGRFGPPHPPSVEYNQTIILREQRRKVILRKDLKFYL